MREQLGIESDFSSPYGRDVAEEDTFARISPSSFLERAALAYRLARITESPIETIFGVSAITLFQLHFEENFELCEGPERPQNKLLLIPQYRWARFRIDWAFTFNNQELLFVECDGKDFHSSPEQVARDRKRDQAFAEVGIECLRFWGTDLTRNDETCATIALSAVLRKMR
jgi:hypothetical protein